MLDSVGHHGITVREADAGNTPRAPPAAQTPARTVDVLALRQSGPYRSKSVRSK